MQLPPAISQPQRVRGVNYPDQAFGSFEVVPPVCADRRLPANIPDVQLVPLVLHRVDLEAQSRRDGRDVLAVELFDDGGLSGVVKAHQKQLHLALLQLELLEDGVQAHSRRADLAPLLAAAPVQMSIAGRALRGLHGVFAAAAPLLRKSSGRSCICRFRRVPCVRGGGRRPVRTICFAARTSALRRRRESDGGALFPPFPRYRR
eukprot:SAG31_NODE_71_length_28115_cov_4.128105_5_plen_204_part_00